MFSSTLRASCETLLSRRCGSFVKVTGWKPVSGGCINNAVILETDGDSFFMKWNDAGAFPGMFEAEAKGLELLRSTGTVKVPVVVGQGSADERSFLILGHIVPGRRKKSFWEEMGNGLASLHRCTADSFGLGHDNYIGLLKQSNSSHQAWSGFFAAERLEKQSAIAFEARRLSAGHIKLIRRLYEKLDRFFPAEPPALLHGDLWPGNYLTDHEGSPCLIDPAVYYGHREVDLSMPLLFGGFDEKFYAAYHECFPLEKGFYDRADLYNLYPLLVHLNLFGSAYLGQVEEVLHRFT